MRLVHRSAVSLSFAALAFGFAALASAPAAAQERFDWSKWYAGAGIGLGINAHYKQDGRTLNFDQPGATEKSALAAFNVNGGLQLDPKTLVGLAVSGVGKTGKINGAEAHTQINNYFAMYTYFPHESGFFMRAGGGYSNIVVDDGSVSVSTGGAGIQAGLGYAWRLLTEHYVTLTVDQSFQFYHSNTDHRPTRSEFSAVYLGYMYRR